ncbi:MAG: glycosyl hydrolase 115 family protein [Rikenellaceae bacterium]
MYPNPIRRRLLLTFVALVNVIALSAKGFTLYDGTTPAQIYFAEDEPTPLKIAAQHLCDDIEMVTGKSPKITSDKSALSGNVIILTTPKNNSYTDGKKLDGLYQSYLMRAVKSPLKGVDNALVMVGCDALGAAYGVYNISEKIGVSPFYWYCDITPRRQSRVVIEECNVDPHQPSVKYRGIFINDEEAKILWSRNRSATMEQGITPETYKRVYEFMLRMGANTLWPSMMEEGAFFFEAKDENGIALNPKNATDYGVFIGTSHCENMARNNNAEWYEWAARNPQLFSDDLHEFDYTVNPKAIEQYWLERLQECKNFNIVYTLGIRAVHDSAFRRRLMANPTLENKVKMLQQVINRQREMIAQVFGSADAVPQVFVPYEETAELYNGETRNGEERCKGLDVPEDVMLISTDDNYGFLRQLPTQKELKRSGGCGIYYHIAYQGNPSPYDWLTTMPYKLMQEELRKLYEIGSMSFWIVNVGDIKPSELGLKYFMEIANDADRYFAEEPAEYLKESAAKLFDMDAKRAAQFADLFTRFCVAANRQKPDFMSSFTSIGYNRGWIKFGYYSSFDFNDEAQRMISGFNAMEAEAKAMYDSVPADRRDAFFHLAYYPIRSTHLMAQKSYYYYKNMLYEKQGRFASLNLYGDLAKQATDEIDRDLHYYNKVLAGGKWDGIMDPYATYNIYERVLDDANIPHHLVYAERFKEDSTTEALGAVCEGQVIGNEEVELLFSSLEDNRRFIDVFAKGAAPQTWSVSSSSPWVKFSERGGTTNVEQRIWVTIDWSALEAGDNRARIDVKNRDGVISSFPIVATKITEKIRPRSYVEGAGFVAIEMENYTKRTKGSDGSQWVKIDNLGYVGSSMVVDGGAKVSNPVNGATLEYQVYFTSKGTFDATLFRLPTLNEGKGKSCNIAISVDGAKPIVIDCMRRKMQNMVRHRADGSEVKDYWMDIAYCQMEKIIFPITINKPGYHTIRFHQIDDAIALDRFVIATTKQSSVAQERAVIGAPESYNTIVKNFEPQREDAEVKVTKSATEIPHYPSLTPMIYSKFLFSKIGFDAPHGFTLVSDRHVYTNGATLFGWGKGDSVKSTLIFGSRSLPFFRLSSHYADTPATFHALMHEGNYEVMIHAGTITSYYRWVLIFLFYFKI